MGSHGDPVAAVHLRIMFLEPFYGENRTAFFLAHVGHIDRIDENLGKRTVKTAADGRPFLLAFFGERVPQIGLHDLHAVAQAIIYDEKEQVFNNVVFEPVGHHGKHPRPEPQGLQPYLLYEIQLCTFHPANQRLRFDEKFYVGDLGADSQPVRKCRPVDGVGRDFRRDHADERRIERRARNVERNALHQQIWP